MGPPRVIDRLRRLATDARSPCGGAPHVGRALRLLAFVVCGLALLAMVLVALYLARRDTQSEFSLGVTLAILPVPLYLAILVWVDRFELESFLTVAALFMWGAGVAVVLAYTVNTTAGALVAERKGPVVADAYFFSVFAPVVEELLKAAPLFALLIFDRERIDNLLDGVVLAAIVGLGFATSENVFYYGNAALSGGLREALDLFALRGVWGPFIHPLLTAATGIGVAYAATRRGALRWWAPVLGLLIAIALHSLWNTVGRSAWFDLVYIALFVPLLLMVALAVLRVRRQEATVVAEYLGRGMGSETGLPIDFVEQLASVESRRSLRRAAHQRGGAEGRRAATDYEDAATELAFLVRRLDQGRAPDDGRHHAALEQLRRRVLDRGAELYRLGVVS